MKRGIEKKGSSTYKLSLAYNLERKGAGKKEVNRKKNQLKNKVEKNYLKGLHDHDENIEPWVTRTCNDGLALGDEIIGTLTDVTVSLNQVALAIMKPTKGTGMILRK